MSVLFNMTYLRGCCIFVVIFLKVNNAPRISVRTSILALAVGCIIFCLLAVFLICCHSIAPCAFKGGISANAICYIYWFISIDWYISGPSQASCGHFGGLPAAYFYLLRHVHGQWLGGSCVGMSILSIAFVYISVDVNILVAEDDQLYRNSCR